MDQEHSQLIVPSTDDVARVNGRRRLLKGLAAGAAGLGALSLAASASAHTAAQDAVDVAGGGDGYGLHAGGGLAAIRLKPATASGQPGTANHLNAEFYTDSNGDLYYSVGPAAGGANLRWRKLAGQNPSETSANPTTGGHSQPGSLFFMPFSARVAARDVVNVGAPQLGTFGAINTFSTIQATGVTALNGGQVIPAGAKGILGSVVGAVASAGGRVKVFPSSVTNQALGSASVAYSATAPNVFGFFATTLDAAGAFKVYVFDNYPGVLAIDVFAYFF
jgi:hypothetical protein